MAVSQALKPTERLSIPGRRALGAAFFTFTIDVFDVFLPIIALSPALSYFEPKALPTSTTLTWFFVVFAASLLGRPIGSFIFGHVGDRWGRRRTTLWAIGGFGAATLLMALLPGYKSWGLAALGTMAVLRLIDGIFLGGGYTGATPLAIEAIPGRRRGLFGGFINSGTGIAFAAIALMTLVSLHWFPPSTGQYAQVGWRIPFLAGVVLAAVLFVYYYRKVEESPLWKETTKSAHPLRDLFHGTNLRRLIEIFVVMTGVWFVTNSTLVPIPALLETVYKVPSTLVTTIEIVANVLMFGSFMAAGALSDRFGRKRMLAVFGIINIVIAPFVYLWVLADAKSSPELLWISLPLLFILTNSVFGVLTAFITERFSTRVRSSGYGIGYSIGIVIPAFSSFYMLGLKTFVPYADTALLLEILSGILILVGSLLGPELKGRQLAD